MLFACLGSIKEVLMLLFQKAPLRHLTAGGSPHGYGFHGGDSFTSLCCATMWSLCGLFYKRRVMRWRRLDSKKLYQSGLHRIQEAGFYPSVCLPRASKHVSALGQHFFFPSFHLRGNRLRGKFQITFLEAVSWLTPWHSLVIPQQTGVSGKRD